MLVLIGYRGTGKSTVAQLLARRLGWECADLDEHIEQAAGKSIAEIFAQEGEPAFRDREAAALARELERDKLVLAAGGGVVLREDNRRALRSVSQAGGRVIWLTASAATIFQRLTTDQATAARRPNLTATGGLREIEQLLADRRPLYAECADAAVDTEGRSPNDVAAEILRLLRERGTRW